MAVYYIILLNNLMIYLIILLFILSLALKLYINKIAIFTKYLNIEY